MTIASFPKAFLALVGIFLGLVTSQAAHAAQATVFGLDRYANARVLPSQVCVTPGTELRLVADALDSATAWRLWIPAEQFAWRLTRLNGIFQEWSPAYGWGYGPFRRGVEPNSVYLFVPLDLGAFGKLEVATPGAVPVTFYLVDPRLSAPPYGKSCAWAHSDVYRPAGFPR